MRYYLIDRVERIEYQRTLRALKNVTLAEDYFNEHFALNPVMPGALLIETLAQAGTALLEISCDVSKKAFLVMVERAKFRDFVRPGDQLAVTVTVQSADHDVARLSGTIHRGDQLVADANVVFALRDAAEVYPPQTHALVRAGYDVLLRGATVVRSTEAGDG